MELLFLLKAALLGIVEGITEFLPISSTAHLILVGDWLKFNSNVFTVVIQLGAIFAVIVLYYERIWQLIKGFFTGNRPDIHLALNLILAFLPAAIIGLILIKYIHALLEGHFMVYAITLFVGGLIMLCVERHPVMAKDAQHLAIQQEVGLVQTLEGITWKQALAVGFAQCLAMIPGTSRSGATIIGGMVAGLSRKTATEFSFFLAIPTMLGATVLDLAKYHSELNSDTWLAIAVGFVFAFISAIVVIKALMRFLGNHSYRIFGWYRIILGVIIGVLTYNTFL